jgi:hypothetical protein
MNRQDASRRGDRAERNSRNDWEPTDKRASGSQRSTGKF